MKISLDMEWLLDKRICLLNTENPVTSQEVERCLEDLGFSLVVTIRDYDYSLSWGVSDSNLRHYQCSFSNYLNPTERDLQDLNEYCLYELSHGRKVPIWIEDARVRHVVGNSVRTFFAPGMEDIDSFIQTSLLSQRDRMLALPQVDKLTRCQFCIDKGCMTDLVCHATSIETARRIVDSGRILSACKASQVPGEKLASDPRNAAGDPPDYFEYVMFSAGNCPGPDKLVYERIIGRSPSWEEFEENFQPAVKFFFRSLDLIMHPDFCCDGYHRIKIRDEIALEPLLLVVIIPEGLAGSTDLIESANKRELAAKVVSRDFSGYGPKEWAHLTYLVARQFADN